MSCRAQFIYLKHLRKAGGEGSRGGKIIGRTRSNKPIYESSSSHYSKGDRSVPHAGHVEEAFNKLKYTAEDHKDAAFHHNAEHRLAEREVEEHGYGGQWTGMPGGEKWEGRKKAAAAHRQIAQKLERE